MAADGTSSESKKIIFDGLGLGCGLQQWRTKAMEILTLSTQSLSVAFCPRFMDQESNGQVRGRKAVSDRRRKMTVQPIGQKIVGILKERNWSRAVLAKKVGVEKSHFARMLRGERPWQVDILKRAASVLCVDLADLVADTDAAGLLDAEKNAHEANKALTEELAKEAADNASLRAQLQAVEKERDDAVDALRKERAFFKKKREDDQTELKELRSRPTRAEFDALWDERDRYMNRTVNLETQLAERDQENAGLRLRISRLIGALKRAQAQVATNYQAYLHWRQEAESRGATLKGVALAAAGYGIVKLLSGGDDEYIDT